MNNQIVMFLIFLKGSQIFTNEITTLASNFKGLQQTRHVGICNFIICSSHESLNIIKKMSDNNECLTSIHEPRDNITKWFTTEDRQMFIVDVSCPLSLKFLQKANDINLLKGRHIWLFFQSSQFEDISHSEISFEDIANNLDNVELTIRSEIYLVVETSPKRFQLIGLYKRDPDDSIIKENLTDWTFNNGFTNPDILTSAVRRHNLEGKLFKAAIVMSDEKSMKHLDDLVDTHIDSLSKVGHAAITLAIEALNAKVDFIVTPEWGTEINGTFNGMIGYVQRGEAEIAATHAFALEDRLHVLEFVEKTVRTRTKFLFLSPPLSYSYDIYLLPLDINLWFCSVGVIIIILPVIYYMSKLESEAFNNSKKSMNHEQQSERYSWSDVLMLSIAAAFQQGYRIKDATGLAVRIMIITFYLTLITIYISYAAFIVVALQSTDKSMSTLKDLLGSNLEIGAHDVSYNRHYFKVINDPIRKRIAKKVIPDNKPDHFLTLEDGIEHVKQGLYAFHVELSPGYYMIKRKLTEDEKCNLQELKEAFIPALEPLMGIKKNIPFSKMLRITFKKLHERGFANRISSRLYSSKPTCSRRMMSYVSAGIIDIQYSFGFFILVMFLSWIFLLFEISYKKREDRKKKSGLIYEALYQRK